MTNLIYQDEVIPLCYQTTKRGTSSLAKGLDSPILFERRWCMPNRLTFQMKPVREMLEREGAGGDFWVDPFANNSTLCGMSNDVNPETAAHYHQDALEFLRERQSNDYEGCLFDPPYSPEQGKRSYKMKHSGTAGWEEYMSACKNEVARIVRVGGKVICFGWHSNGMGKTRGFQLVRGMLLAHGGGHYDTIITVEVKQ